MTSRTLNVSYPAPPYLPQEVPSDALAGDFRTLANYIPHIVWAARPNGEIEYLNQRGLEYLGMSGDEVLRIGFDHLIHPEDAYRAKRSWNDSLERLSRYESEYRLRRYDGVYRWHVSRGHPVVDETGRLVRWFGTCTDVHDSRFAASMLAESEERFRATFNQMGVGIAHHAADGKCIRVNDSLCAMLGYSREQMLNLSFHHIIHPEDLQMAHGLQARFLAGEIAKATHENRVIRADGATAWVRTTISFVRHRLGAPNFFIVEVQDISARKQHEFETGEMRAELERLVEGRTAQLSAALKQIQSEKAERARAEAMSEAARTQLLHSARMSALGEMACTVAQEVHGPLCSMRNLASDLRDAAVTGNVCTSRIRRTASEMVAVVERMEHVTSSLCAFAKNGSQNQAQPASVRAMIDDTLAFCRRRFLTGGIELHVDIPEGLTSHFDPAGISQVVLNLLNNAYDAVHATPSPWVRIEASGNDNGIAISITDSGPGIAPALADKILLPFFTTKAARHAGLGLSISRDIVEGHGGQLVIDSSCPNTRFVITLPDPQYGLNEEKP